MSIFLPILAGFAAAAALAWASVTLASLRRSIPRSNADFGLPGPNRSLPPRAGNPAAEFYAGSRSAQALGALLRVIERVAPRFGTAAALRLFLTPLPWKLARRIDIPSRWSAGAWAFEDVSLAVYRCRALAAGRPPVLLVHGWAGNSAQMFHLGDALADAGYDPVLIDFPGHGRSGGWRSTLPQFARAIHAVVARLGPLHGVVGHSLGGIAAMHALARGLPAQRLVLVSPSAPPALFLRWFVRSFGLSDTVFEGMRRWVEAREDVVLDHFEPEWLGPRINQRVLVIHDRQDRVAPFSAAERVVCWLSDGRLLPTEGLGHARVLKDPLVAREIVAHLA